MLATEADEWPLLEVRTLALDAYAARETELAARV
jgi:hypothetical protein